jgi:hypothetical protein
VITAFLEKGQSFFLLPEHPACLGKLEFFHLLMLATEVEYLLEMKTKQGLSLS